MEPSGRKPVATSGRCKKRESVQSSRNRCRRLRPPAAGTPWAVPWREAWPAEIEDHLLNSVSERHDRAALAGYIESWKADNIHASVEIVSG